MRGLICGALAGCLYCSAALSETLRIAVASSLLPLVEKITLADTQIQITGNASGVLHAQITHGARYDLFIVADGKYLDSLQDRALLLEANRHCIASASLVLASDGKAPSLAELKSNDGTKSGRLVIADPAHAPFGRAATEILRHMGSVQYWHDHRILARSAAQATQYVATRHARIGILPESLARHHGLKFTEIPASYHAPVVYELGVLTPANPAAAGWLHQLRGQIQNSYGLKPCNNA